MGDAPHKFSATEPIKLPKSAGASHRKGGIAQLRTRRCAARALEANSAPLMLEELEDSIFRVAVCH